MLAPSALAIALQINPKPVPIAENRPLAFLADFFFATTKNRIRN
jgi:hypothetical protein